MVIPNGVNGNNGNVNREEHVDQTPATQAGSR
jgi:hypothetical protein